MQGGRQGGMIQGVVGERPRRELAGRVQGAGQQLVHGAPGRDQVRLCEIVDEQGALEMRAQKKSHWVARGELTLGGDDERLEQQVRAPQMRDSLVHVGVGDLNDGLGHQPRVPVVGSEHRVEARCLGALDGDGREPAAIRRHGEQGEGSRQVLAQPVYGTGLDALELRVVRQIKPPLGARGCKAVVG